MTMEKEFQCGKCKSRKKADKAPDCCGQEMEPLPVCTTASSPEHSRPMSEEEPCDDSRGG